MPITTQPTPVGSNQRPFKHWDVRNQRGMVTNTGGALSAVGAYVHLVSLPTIAFGGGGAAPGKVLVGPLDPEIHTEFQFWAGHGTDADGKTATARLWGLTEWLIGTTTEFAGVYLGELALVGGAAVVHASSIVAGGAASMKWVDTITLTTNHAYTPGLVVYGGSGIDAGPSLVIDPAGFTHILIEALLGTATHLGARFRQF